MFGVVVFVIVVLIMVIYWVKLFYEDCYFDKLIYWFLVIVSVVGIIFVFIFIILCFKNCVNLINILLGIIFLKIKFVFMYIFGVGYLFYCGLYVWKYIFENKCFGNNDIGLVYNILSIIYIFYLFVYFVLFYERKNDNMFGENFVLFFIMVINVCIWLDVIFLELGKVFNDDSMNDIDLIKIINMMNFLNRVEEVIKIIDLFLFFVLIEFLLILIDLLFILGKY